MHMKIASYPMRDIRELTMLLRADTKLPVGLKFATEEFREGWNLVCSGDAQWIDKKIRGRRWHFTLIDEAFLRSGVGETSQEAIDCALKLALRRLSVHFNAAEVEHIELKQYPWFFLAKVKVHPYQIQQSAALPAIDQVISLPVCFPAKGTAGKENRRLSTAS